MIPLLLHTPLSLYPSPNACCHASFRKGPGGVVRGFNRLMYLQRWAKEEQDGQQLWCDLCVTLDLIKQEVGEEGEREKQRATKKVQVKERKWMKDI